MKTTRPDKFNLIEGGKDVFERTNEFVNKVSEIRKELTDEYSMILSNERNWVRSLLIKIKLEIAIRKRIQTLSSFKNLHAIS